jgi:hypothetical protein
MAGISEEVGNTARSVVEAMRAQPLMLAVIVLNAVIITLVYLAITSNRQAQHEIMKALVEQSTKAQELLSRCVVPKNANWVEVPPL